MAEVKQSPARIISGAAFFVGINVAIANNDVKFNLDGWAKFGVGVLACATILTALVVFVRSYQR